MIFIISFYGTVFYGGPANGSPSILVLAQVEIRTFQQKIIASDPDLS